MFGNKSYRCGFIYVVCRFIYLSVQYSRYKFVRLLVYTIRKRYENNRRNFVCTIEQKYYFDKNIKNDMEVLRLCCRNIELMGKKHKI